MEQPLGALAEEQPARRVPWGCLLFAASLFGLFAYFVPRFLNAKADGKLTACKSLLKNTATAIEMYAADNAATLPNNLEQLVSGNYLRELPKCYVNYQPYRYEHEGSQFTLICEGTAHFDATGFPPHRNYPRFSRRNGLEMPPP